MQFSRFLTKSRVLLPFFPIYRSWQTLFVYVICFYAVCFVGFIFLSCLFSEITLTASYQQYILLLPKSPIDFAQYDPLHSFACPRPCFMSYSSLLMRFIVSKLASSSNFICSPWICCFFLHICQRYSLLTPFTDRDTRCLCFLFLQLSVLFLSSGILFF